MPNIKSAKKRVKVIATKTARNKANKSALRTAIKKAFYAIDTNADNKQEAGSSSCYKENRPGSCQGNSSQEHCCKKQV